MGFGKRITIDVKKEKPIVKSNTQNNVVKDKISRFNKKSKIKSCNDFNLSKQERVELFIKNKIKSSNRFNGWYITISAFNFSEKIGHETDLIYLTDLIEKLHKNKG